MLAKMTILANYFGKCHSSILNYKLTQLFTQSPSVSSSKTNFLCLTECLSDLILLYACILTPKNARKVEKTCQKMFFFLTLFSEISRLLD